MARQHPRSYPLSTICFRSENFIPQRDDGLRIRRISRTKSPRLTAGEPWVWPLVQFFQVRQRIDGQLIRVVLSGSAELVDISDNFLSGLRNPRGVELAGQPVGVQRMINNFVHRKLRTYCTALVAMQHSDFAGSSSIFNNLPMTLACGPNRWGGGSRPALRMICRPEPASTLARCKRRSHANRDLRRLAKRDVAARRGHPRMKCAAMAAILICGSRINPQHRHQA